MRTTRSTSATPQGYWNPTITSSQQHRKMTTQLTRENVDKVLCGNWDPYVDLVRKRRLHKDRGVATMMEWYVHNVNELETHVADAIQSNVGQRVDTGWFVEQLLERVRVTAIECIPRADLSVRTWDQILGVMDESAIAKARKLIREHVLPKVTAPDGRDQYPLLSGQNWKKIEIKWKEEGAKLVEEYLHLEQINLFDGWWFHIYLLHWALKGLSQKQLDDLRPKAGARAEAEAGDSRRIAVRDLLD
ncbi:hypothetical protein K440DRAFT_644485 [Wilcoxina mikolae CBS 423.85]|nr:hypothetical protein K440DRAFT_644485 [Wilcoxina mikolae CBS 423.85]